MSDPGPVAQAFGRIAYEFALVQPLLPTYFHLLASALFPIYAGAHASLSRPSSAAKPGKKQKKSATGEEEDDQDEEEEYQRMEGLSPTDALMFPLMAGTTLAALYFLIKWLQDPTLLNKILNGYFAIFGVFSVSRLVTDGLDIGHSLIFPKRYALGGTLYQVSNKDKSAKPVSGSKKGSEIVHSPLPGFLSRIPLPDRFRELLWVDRAMPSNKWTVRMYIHRMVAAKMKIGSHGVAGFFVALAAVTYFNFVDKPWYLTNLMGFGFSYGALQLMSPTTFATGSLILGALFVYDIYFVFFTPMMVTVAKSLDVPIKLMFPRPSAPGADPAILSHAMLGLGDVVLPGIMIGLALRYDLYLFYLRKQVQSAPALDLDDGNGARPTVVKEKYFSLSGRWSEHFWTHTLTGRPLFSVLAPQQPHFTFPKTYFNASLVGYVIGMLTTLGVMQIYGHAQPALLYLVPGVLGSIWITALIRGELKETWNYTEAIDEEELKEQDPDGATPVREQRRPSFFSLESQQRQADKMERVFNRHVKSEDSDWEDAGNNKSSSDDLDHKDSTDSLTKSERLQKEDIGKDTHEKTKKITSRNKDREIFSFSIEAPWTLSAPQSIAKPVELSSESDKRANITAIEVHDSSSVITSSMDPETDFEEEPKWKALERQKTDGEPVGKRLRTA